MASVSDRHIEFLDENGSDSTAWDTSADLSTLVGLKRLWDSFVSDSPSRFPTTCETLKSYRFLLCVYAGIILHTIRQMRAFSPDATDALPTSPHLSLQAQFLVPDS